MIKPGDIVSIYNDNNGCYRVLGVERDKFCNKYYQTILLEKESTSSFIKENISHYKSHYNLVDDIYYDMQFQCCFMGYLTKLEELTIFLPDGSSIKRGILPKLGLIYKYNKKDFEVVEVSENGESVWLEEIND